MRSAAVYSSDASWSQIPFDLKTGTGLGCNMPGLVTQEHQCGSHLMLGYQTDVLKDQEDLTNVQYKMNWD